MFINMGPPELGIKCPLQDCLTIARKAGFEGIDIDIFEIKQLSQSNGASYVSDLLDQYNMKLGAWIWFDHFGFSDSESDYQSQLELLPRLAEAAAAVGATRVLSWILPFSDHLDYKKNFDQHATRIKAALTILNDHGQRLALEYIGPKTFRDGHAYPFIHTMAEALELIDKVNETNVGLIMDSWHWYTSHGTLQDVEDMPSERAFYVHLSDAPQDVPVDEQIDDVRRLPGTTGVIRNDLFLDALGKSGYEGPITAEPFSEEINALPAEEAAKRAAAALRQLRNAAVPK